MKRTFSNHKFYRGSLGLDWSHFRIISKKGRIYDYMDHLETVTKKWDVLDGSYCIYARFNLENTTFKKPFIFIQVRNGWIISDQIHNYHPSEILINLYQETIGKEKRNAEQETFDEIEPHLRRIFTPKRFELERNPKGRSIQIGTEINHLDWMERFNTTIPKWTEPDFIAYDTKRNHKELFIEVERGVRSEIDIQKKYWKQHYLDRKLYYIFETEVVQQHYLEVLNDFEQRDEVRKRRFKSFNYLLKEELPLKRRLTDFHTYHHNRLSIKAD